MLITSSFDTVAKKPFLNLPLLIALLITSVVHFLLISKLKIDLPNLKISHHTLEITLIKPLPHPPLPVLTVPVPSVVEVRKPPHKPAVAKKVPVQSEKHSSPLAKTPKPKKRRKSPRPVVRTDPLASLTPPDRVVAVTAPVAVPEVDLAVPVEPTPVAMPEIPAAPVIPEPALAPKIDTPPAVPETVAPSDSATPDVAEKPADLPIKPRQKSGKKSRKKRSSSTDSPQTPLSLDDLALQIAQVGEKFGNQAATAGESRVKTLNAIRERKGSARQYILDWQHKVERIGNLNYPEAARQKDFTAKLVMEVGINADGSLHSVKIKKSSGTPALDEAAKNIVQMGAPFAALPKDLGKELDVLLIQRVWQFSDDSGMTTQ